MSKDEEAHQLQKKEPTIEHGILVEAVQYCLFYYIRFLVFWGWAGLFELKDDKKTIIVKQKTLYFDVIYVVRIAISILIYCLVVPELFTHTTIPFWCLAACSWAVFRAIDHLLTALWIVILGNKAGPSTNQQSAWLSQTSTYRLRRSIIIVLIDYIDILLLYTVIYSLINHCDPNAFSPRFDKMNVAGRSSQALLLSMSTLTTVGYGTNSPVAAVSIWTATLEVMTGLIILGGYLATLVPLLASKTETQEDDRDTLIQTGQQAIILRKHFQIRRWLPPTSNSIVLAIIYCILHYFSS